MKFKLLLLVLTTNVLLFNCSKSDDNDAAGTPPENNASISLIVNLDTFDNEKFEMDMDTVTISGDYTLLKGFDGDKDATFQLHLENIGDLENGNYSINELGNGHHAIFGIASSSGTGAYHTTKDSGNLTVEKVETIDNCELISGGIQALMTHATTGAIISVQGTFTQLPSFPQCLQDD